MQVILTIVDDNTEPGALSGNGSLASPTMIQDGRAVGIPIEGSLGILAMGYVGIMLWRAERRAASNKS